MSIQTDRTSKVRISTDHESMDVHREGTTRYGEYMAAQDDEDDDSILYSQRAKMMNFDQSPGPPGIVRAMKSQVADSFDERGGWHERSHTYYQYDVGDDSLDNEHENS